MFRMARLCKPCSGRRGPNAIVFIASHPHAILTYSAYRGVCLPSQMSPRACEQPRLRSVGLSLAVFTFAIIPCLFFSQQHPPLRAAHPQPGDRRASMKRAALGHILLPDAHAIHRKHHPPVRRQKLKRL